ncbi:hypothetical protein ACBJ59_36790 [Nonomuraea sp. MTCD27]|uniref:hypothetical protein n=1 Tax=Nonomuraea sp. MTCD27 TaxID=1676747 RepID=UPI0035BEC077
MTMLPPTPITAQMRDFERRLRMLEHMHPAWTIRRRPHTWIAVRITPPNAEQAAAGMRQFLIEPNLDALVAALAGQLLIAQTPDAA